MTDKRKMRRINVSESDYQEMVSAAARLGLIPKSVNGRRDTAKEGVERFISEGLPHLIDWSLVLGDSE